MHLLPHCWCCLVLPVGAVAAAGICALATDAVYMCVQPSPLRGKGAVAAAAAVLVLEVGASTSSASVNALPPHHLRVLFRQPLAWPLAADLKARKETRCWAVLLRRCDRYNQLFAVQQDQ